MPPNPIRGALFNCGIRGPPWPHLSLSLSLSLSPSLAWLSVHVCVFLGGCGCEQLLHLALEKQAVGRVYRLGQERPVTVSSSGVSYLFRGAPHRVPCTMPHMLLYGGRAGFGYVPKSICVRHRTCPTGFAHVL